MSLNIYWFNFYLLAKIEALVCVVHSCDQWSSFYGKKICHENYFLKTKNGKNRGGRAKHVITVLRGILPSGLSQRMALNDLASTSPPLVSHSCDGSSTALNNVLFS